MPSKAKQQPRHDSAGDDHAIVISKTSLRLRAVCTPVPPELADSLWRDAPTAGGSAAARPPTRRPSERRARRPSVPVSFWREPEAPTTLVWNVGEVESIAPGSITLLTHWYAPRGTRVMMRMLVGTQMYAFNARVARSMDLLCGSSRIMLAFEAPQRDLCATLERLSRARGGRQAA